MQQQPIETYLQTFASLTPASLDRLVELFAENARFKDPFNDIRGRPAIRAVFEKMFEDVDCPQFTIVGIEGSSSRYYVRWVFRGHVKGRSISFSIEGMSEILLDASAKVTSHIDFWDPAEGFYEKLPVLGWVLRRIRKRLAVSFEK